MAQGSIQVSLLAVRRNISVARVDENRQILTWRPR